MYQIRILDAAAVDLARLDPAIARRVVNRVRWLAENLEDVKPEALTGDLSGFYKLRIGEYRVVYEIMHSEQVIVIDLIGHHREICRQS
jgi:mRNA interferase RelE/StbE